MRNDVIGFAASLVEELTPNSSLLTPNSCLDFIPLTIDFIPLTFDFRPFPLPPLGGSGWGPSYCLFYLVIISSLC